MAIFFAKPKGSDVGRPRPRDVATGARRTTSATSLATWAGRLVSIVPGRDLEVHGGRVYSRSRDGMEPRSALDDNAAEGVLSNVVRNLGAAKSSTRADRRANTTSAPMAVPILPRKSSVRKLRQDPAALEEKIGERLSDLRGPQRKTGCSRPGASSS